MEWRWRGTAVSSAIVRQRFLGAAVCAMSGAALVLSGCGRSDRVTGPATPTGTAAETAAAPPDEGAASAAVACTINHLSLTLLRPQSYVVRAAGSFQGCSSPSVVVTMRIQRHRWYGWQETGAETTIRANGTSSSVQHNCFGDGIHTYRAFVFARTLGGDGRSKESNHITTNCGV